MIMAKKQGYTAHVSDEKKGTVKEFASLIRQYPIVAAVNMENLPAKQLQNMRAMLRAKGVVLLMTKRRLLNLAIAEAKKDKPGIEAILPHLKGMPALLFAKDNPFSLYKTLQKNKSSAPARAGQVAPKDIIVPAGATPFAPGPVIGELGQAGIKAGIEGGKVVAAAKELGKRISTPQRRTAAQDTIATKPSQLTLHSAGESVSATCVNSLNEEGA